MSLKFEAVKSWNVGEQVFLKTGKCFSFGVKKDKRIENAIFFEKC